MKLEILPSLAKGSVTAPPSKSMAHRAMFCAAMAKGESVISPVSLSEDMGATADALSALGAEFVREGDKLRVRGFGFPRATGKTVDCRESGSTLRFVLPLCLLTGERIRLEGAERLFARPLSVYESLCREKGFLWEQGERGLTVCGKLLPGHYRVAGDVSSQFITGLLFALSLLEGESVLEITGQKESASYIDMTLSVMADFGAKVQAEENAYRIFGGAGYIPRAYTVEGDASNAAFLDAFSLLGGSVRVLGLREDSLQGDRVYRRLFEQMRHGNLEADLSDCPDLAPILIALAAAGQGAVFTGTRRLRIKESDRGLAMAEELKKCGVTLCLEENRIVVPGGMLKPPAEPVCGHNDHRIVMAMSVLLSRLGGVIEGAEAVAKSYPDFFEEIKKLGIEVIKK